jgi:hypothetical protein
LNGLSGVVASLRDSASRGDRLPCTVSGLRPTDSSSERHHASSVRRGTILEASGEAVLTGRYVD